MKKMNIIEIIWHDLGKHLGLYGYKTVKSPNLDAFSKESCVFDRAFCTSPLCSPSRAGIITGRYPHQNGMLGLSHRGFSINSSEYILQKTLKELGYSTTLFGVQHVCAKSEAAEILSYDECYQDILRPEEVIEEFPKWLAKKKNEDKPFFMSMGAFYPHRPHGRGEASEDAWKSVEMLPYLPDTEGVRKDLANYEELIRKMDTAFGFVIDTLKKEGVYDNTLILFTTDHGSDYPRSKSALYDAGLEVAFMVRYPGSPKNGKRVSSLISNIDVWPTFIECAGGEIPDTIEGKSFLPLLKGDSYTTRTEIFGERTWHNTYDPIRCIRTDKYKLIRNFKAPYKPHLAAPEFIKMAGKEVVEEFFGKMVRVPYELYNLENDPNEFINLADNPEYKDAFEDLKAKLQAHLERTKDPILKGDIPHPGRHDDVWDWKDDNGKWILHNFKEDIK